MWSDGIQTTGTGRPLTRPPKPPVPDRQLGPSGWHVTTTSSTKSTTKQNASPTSSADCKHRCKCTAAIADVKCNADICFYFWGEKSTHLSEFPFFPSRNALTLSQTTKNMKRVNDLAKLQPNAYLTRNACNLSLTSIHSSVVLHELWGEMFPASLECTSFLHNDVCTKCLYIGAFAH